MLVTSGDGLYVIPFLRPCIYEITVVAPGFEKYSQSDIVLEVNQKRKDVTLTVGELTQAVTVRAEAAALESASGSMAQPIKPHSVVELPRAE